MDLKGMILAAAETQVGKEFAQIMATVIQQLEERLNSLEYELLDRLGVQPPPGPRASTSDDIPKLPPVGE